MSEHYIVWVNVTHRIEVEADNEEEAHEIAVYNTDWDRSSMSHCSIDLERNMRYHHSYYTDLVGHKG